MMEKVFEIEHIMKMNIIWQPPVGEFIKVNTDEACKGRTSQVRCGGILRNSYGS